MPPQQMQAKRSLHRIVLAAALLTWSGCSSAPSCPTIAPLGEYEVEVGEPWSAAIITLRDGAGGLRWTLLEGPQDLRLITTQGPPRLVWLATALDLALTQPGRARLPGRKQAIRIQACDAAGCCVERSGTIRAVPSAIP